MKHWSLLLLPLAMASLSSHAAVLPSDCSSKDVAIGSAVNSATGVNSRCSAASTKQRVEHAVDNPGDYAKRKAAQQVRDTAAELLSLYAQRAARKGRNPRTGEEIQIPAGFGVKLTAGSALKKAVAK
mgnify:CR=1 FL=1